MARSISLPLLGTILMAACGDQGASSLEADAAEDASTGDAPDGGTAAADAAAPADAGCATDRWSDWEPKGELLELEELGTWSPGDLRMALEYWDADELSTDEAPDSVVYRIRYSTQAPGGTDRESTGLATIPLVDGDVSVLAWQHGTTGVADGCAPSTLVYYGVEGAAAAQAAGWMARGWATVLTDYTGLGTESVHPYVVSEAEGASVIDGIRALHELADAVAGARVSATTVLAGHSQGGHATLAAHEMMASYGPELDYRGAVAQAPGSEFVTTMLQYLDEPERFRTAFGVLLLYAWSEYYGLPLDGLLQEPWLRQVPGWAETDCLEAFANHFPARPDPSEIIGNAITANRFVELLELNSPRACGDAPIRLQVGSDDFMIPGATTDALHSALCASGNVVEKVVYPGGHGAPGWGGATVDAVFWSERIVAGERPVDDCAPR